MTSKTTSSILYYTIIHYSNFIVIEKGFPPRNSNNKRERLSAKTCVCVLCIGFCIWVNIIDENRLHSTLPFNGSNIINIIKLSCSFYRVRIVARHLAEKRIIINIVLHSRHLSRYSGSKLHSDKILHVVKTINYTKCIVALLWADDVNTRVDRKTVELITINNSNAYCVHHNIIMYKMWSYFIMGEYYFSCYCWLTLALFSTNTTFELFLKNPRSLTSILTFRRFFTAPFIFNKIIQNRII